eukprot:11182197-Lingulodinium_polyedra.AAC.1
MQVDVDVRPVRSQRMSFARTMRRWWRRCTETVSAGPGGRLSSRRDRREARRLRMRCSNSRVGQWKRRKRQSYAEKSKG